MGTFAVPNAVPPQPEPKVFTDEEWGRRVRRLERIRAERAADPTITQRYVAVLYQQLRKL